MRKMEMLVRLTVAALVLVIMNDGEFLNANNVGWRDVGLVCFFAASRAPPAALSLQLS